MQDEMLSEKSNIQRKEWKELESRRLAEHSFNLYTRIPNQTSSHTASDEEMDGFSASSIQYTYGTETVYTLRCFNLLFVFFHLVSEYNDVLYEIIRIYVSIQVLI